MRLAGGTQVGSVGCVRGWQPRKAPLERHLLELPAMFSTSVSPCNGSKVVRFQQFRIDVNRCWTDLDHIGQVWPGIGSKVGPSSADFGPSSAKSCRSRPNSGRIRPNLTDVCQIRPSSSESGRCSAKTCTDIAPELPAFGQVWLRSTKFVPMPTKFGPRSPLSDFGQCRMDLPHNMVYMLGADSPEGPHEGPLEYRPMLGRWRPICCRVRPSVAAFDLAQPEFDRF